MTLWQSGGIQRRQKQIANVSNRQKHVGFCPTKSCVSIVSGISRSLVPTPSVARLCVRLRAPLPYSLPIIRWIIHVIPTTTTIYKCAFICYREVRSHCVMTMIWQIPTATMHNAYRIEWGHSRVVGIHGLALTAYDLRHCRWGLIHCVRRSSLAFVLAFGNRTLKRWSGVQLYSRVHIWHAAPPPLPLAI